MLKKVKQKNGIYVQAPLHALAMAPLLSPGTFSLVN
jgi:hypothetical protein